MTTEFEEDTATEHFVKAFEKLVAEYGTMIGTKCCAVVAVTDTQAQPMAFAAIGTTEGGAREILCRAITISYTVNMMPLGETDPAQN